MAEQDDKKGAGGVILIALVGAAAIAAAVVLSSKARATPRPPAPTTHKECNGVGSCIDLPNYPGNTIDQCTTDSDCPQQVIPKVLPDPPADLKPQPGNMGVIIYAIDKQTATYQPGVRVMVSVGQPSCQDVMVNGALIPQTGGWLELPAGMDLYNLSAVEPMKSPLWIYNMTGAYINTLYPRCEGTDGSGVAPIVGQIIPRIDGGYARVWVYTTKEAVRQ